MEKTTLEGIGRNSGRENKQRKITAKMEERHQKCLRNVTAAGAMAKERHRFLNKRRPEQDMQTEKENTHKVNDI